MKKTCCVSVADQAQNGFRVFRNATQATLRRVWDTHGADTDTRSVGVDTNVSSCL